MSTSSVLFIRQKIIRNAAFCTVVTQVEGRNLRISEHFMNMQNHSAEKALLSLPHKLADVFPFISSSVQDGQKNDSRYLCFLLFPLQSGNLKGPASAKTVTGMKWEALRCRLTSLLLTYELMNCSHSCGIYWHIINQTGQVILLEWYGDEQQVNVRIDMLDWSVREKWCQVQFVICLSCHQMSYFAFPFHVWE